jgi:acetyltransferase-like isoleucine patch superfamily enzyme
MEYIKKKYSLKRILRKVLFIIARRTPFIPGKIRPYLFKAGGINFKKCRSNFIGYDVSFDDLNPDLIFIGENTFITEGCKILTHFVDITYNDFNHHYSGKVEIGDNVFLGLNVIITKPIKIGDGAIVGSGSVLTKDVESYSVVGGNPAKLIKKRIIYAN